MFHWKRKRVSRLLILWLTAGLSCGWGLLGAAGVAEHPEWSGIYPHLAFFNQEDECGTGAVVPWGGRLWVITYGPHLPKGSSDKLYEIDPTLGLAIRPESIGGTPANRMVHRESVQLFIGPYVIDRNLKVRTISYDTMPGRLTGNARHLTDPAHKIYYATMEEGFYEVDVQSLAVKELYPDANHLTNHAGDLLPGYHGKGLYSGQGRLVYANNGELSSEAQKRPDIDSGCLAEWDGKDWRVVRRNQFTEVTGPGDLLGNADPAGDPLWSLGWDHRSLLLMVLDEGQWHCFRLPKATHTYDGAHGWNTEWPRIRDIGEFDFLMTMHGMFWRFPRNFSALNTSGIRPRSTYLKVIGDFCRWNDRLVFGCDDAAKSEFLNKRAAKGKLAGPGQSQSGLWFTDPGTPGRLGAPLGRGAVWLRDQVRANTWSDPFLFAGFMRRSAHLAHQGSESLQFEFEVDRQGNGQWEWLQSVVVPPKGHAWVEFPSDIKGEWIRVRTSRDGTSMTVLFTYANINRQPATPDVLFDGLARTTDGPFMGGLVRCQGNNTRTLHMVAESIEGHARKDVGYYELNESMNLQKVNDPRLHAWLKTNAAIPTGILSVDAASAIYVADDGRRWRLPKGDSAFDDLTGIGLARIDREVVTERDLFNCHGTFYELPADNAGGFAKVRPITTHQRRITDYCSWRGLLVMTGIYGGQDNRHIIRSADGKAAVWVGVVDDLWQLGKPVGRGGPWNKTSVKAGVPSDPYLMTGYDQKTLSLSHQGSETVSMTVEVDITGEGDWVTYRSFDVTAGNTINHDFPAAFQAYWVRVTPAANVVATAQLDYR